MDIEQKISSIKKSPNYENMGMIAIHLGIVRAHSRDGRRVKGLKVKYKEDKIEKIVKDIKKMDGIFEVIVDKNEAFLKVGEEVLLVMVGGDKRENVFKALEEAVDRIKSSACEKEEVYC
ncbi:MAG TPA: molybdenum cofactor biosynthesis protein MoaE [Desulfobacteraceae bacterium]|nr:molybdenum cofactor biosynthesis protein MoaE [Desulfobacteraceae bacterium]